MVYDICGGFLAAFGIGAPPESFCALNANDIGPDGRVYISDNGAGPSFVFSDKFRNGRIFVFDPRTGASGVWFDRDTRRELDVQIGGFPEFGVNGVAFSLDGRALYMANMSSDTIYRMLLSNCPGGLPTRLPRGVRPRPGHERSGQHRLRRQRHPLGRFGSERSRGRHRSERS